MTDQANTSRESFEQQVMTPLLWQNHPTMQDKPTDVTYYISQCLSLEADKPGAGVTVTTAWLNGLEKFRHSPVYLEHLAAYFYRHGKYHRSLEFCKKANDLRNSPLARKTAIAAAFAMGQYHLVWDNFLAMELSWREKAETDLLSRCARAALELEKYHEAEKILLLIARRQGAKPLPDLHTSLLAEFGNENNLQRFMKETAAAFATARKLTEISLRNCILYAGVLMHYERYDEAFRILENYRNELIAAR